MTDSIQSIAMRHDSPASPHLEDRTSKDELLPWADPYLASLFSAENDQQPSTRKSKRNSKRKEMSQAFQLSESWSSPSMMSHQLQKRAVSRLQFASLGS